MLKAMPNIEAEVEFEFASFSEEFVPFLAKNQFKSQIRKHAPRPKANSIGEKIALIMAPSQHMIKKDFVRVNMHILPKNPQNYFALPKIVSLPYFQYVSQEALRMLKQSFTPQQETSSFLKYLKKCNVNEDVFFNGDSKQACSNYQPVVERIKVVESIEPYPELKSSDVSIHS